MGERYEFHGITFTWDDRKSKANQRKHRISFETACEAFFDPFVHYVGEEYVGDEKRETLIGMTTDWRLLFVVYVMRAESVRLISARRVTTIERRRYEDQQA